MKTFAKNFRIALANESQRTGLIGLSNEGAIGADGWVKLAGYRDYPLEREVTDAGGVNIVQRFVQRVTKENATALANSHNSFFGKVRKLRRGAPILARHTDRWDIAAQEGIKLAAEEPAALENSKFGVFAKLEAREDGLYGLPIFTDDAHQVIERRGLKYFSPFWWTNIVGMENSTPVAEPTELISVALTDSPNLKDSPALSNARDNKKENTMKKKLIDLMKKHGIALANEEDATIESALEQVDTKLAAQAALANEKSTLSGTVTQLTTERDTARTELTTTRTALANEASEANTLALDLAIAEGRIAPSERGTRLETLKTGGATARKALLNEAPRFKVTPITSDARRAENTTVDEAGAKKAAKRLVALGNEAFAKGGYESPEAAYAAAKETEEGKKLVKQLDEFKAAKE